MLLRERSEVTIFRFSVLICFDNLSIVSLSLDYEMTEDRERVSTINRIITSIFKLFNLKCLQNNKCEYFVNKLHKSLIGDYKR